MGRLDIRICEARNLPDPQTFGKPDPYVIVKLEHQTHKTGVCDNSTDPKWDDVIKFIVADENSAQLRMELWNKNVMADDFLGCYTLSINGLVRGEVKDEWYLLQQCKSNAEIRLRLVANDFGQIPAAAPAQAPPQQAPPQQAPPQQAPGGYPPQQAPGGYPPQQAPGGYPPQQAPGGYPPQQPGGYPPQQAPGGYPPQQPGGYPPQQAPGGYPPQQPGGYPPQQPGGYPPQQPGYPPQQPGYPPQQPGYPPQQPGYPPQQPGYPPQQGYGGY